MSADFSKLNATKAAEEGAWMIVTHPATGEPLKNDDGSEWRLKLIGRDSGAARQARHAAVNKRLTAMAAGVANAQMKSDALEKDGINVLAKCVIGWEGLQDGGQPVEFNEANVKRYLTDHDWFREQVNAFVDNRANFMGNS